MHFCLLESNESAAAQTEVFLKVINQFILTCKQNAVICSRGPGSSKGWWADGR